MNPVARVVTCSIWSRRWLEIRVWHGGSSLQGIQAVGRHESDFAEMLFNVNNLTGPLGMCVSDILVSMSHCEDSDRLTVFSAACNKSGSGDQLRLPPPTQYFERHQCTSTTTSPRSMEAQWGPVVMAICNCGGGWQSRSSSGNLCRSVSVLVFIVMKSLVGEHDG